MDIYSWEFDYFVIGTFKISDFLLFEIVSKVLPVVFDK